MMLQSMAGLVSVAPVLVTTNALPPAAENVHSYDTMLPGADEVLPLNVQFSVVPPLPISHVSDSFGPVTPKRAVADDGFAIVRVADIDAPPYDATMVSDVAPVPVFVENVNWALVVPEGTTTDDAMMMAPMRLESDTVAPPLGAAAVSVTVPLPLLPSTSEASVSVMLASAAVVAPLTVSEACAFAPLVVAAIVLDPAVTAVTVNVAIDAPDAIETEAGTVATLALLLESVTVVADETALLSVTVACVVAPGARVFEARVSATVELGAIGVEACPH
jgi:hypothetical protein